MLVYLLYIISERSINHIYALNENLCILIIVFLILASILEYKFLTKLILSSIALVIAFLHYYILILVSRYESLSLLPLFIVESTSKGSAVSIDFGQIMIIALIAMWRREITVFLRKMRKRLERVGEIEPGNEA